MTVQLEALAAAGNHRRSLLLADLMERVGAFVALRSCRWTRIGCPHTVSE